MLCFPALPPRTLPSFAYAPFAVTCLALTFVDRVFSWARFCFLFSGAVPGCETVQRPGRTLVSEATGLVSTVYTWYCFCLGPITVWGARYSGLYAIRHVRSYQASSKSVRPYNCRHHHHERLSYISLCSPCCSTDTHPAHTAAT